MTKEIKEEKTTSTIAKKKSNSSWYSSITQLFASKLPKYMLNEYPAWEVYFVAVGLIVILGVFVGAGYVYLRYGDAILQINNLSTVTGQKGINRCDLTSLLDKVSNHYLLPEGATPIVTTINNIDPLNKDTPFFSNVSFGDKLIIYPTIGIAILYNESKDIVISAGPACFHSDCFTVKESTVSNLKPVVAKDSTIIVEVRNGTRQAGLAARIATKLLAISNIKFEVSKTSNSSKIYTKNTIVNLGVPDTVIDTLIVTLGGKDAVEVVTKLPEGEAASSAQVLVIAAVSQ